MSIVKDFMIVSRVARTFRCALFLAGILGAAPACGDEPLPLLLEEDFAQGADRWIPEGRGRWEVVKTAEGNHVYRLLGPADFAPPHRSPLCISLLKDVVVGDLELTAQAMTLQTSRNHRDLCLFFGYQSPSRFYYVHLGQRGDPHSNQIFLVHDADRTAITAQGAAGTPWRDDEWHTVKLVRDVASGRIEVYFDDMQTPHMVAEDRTFLWGQIGLGSFDDLGQFADVALRGRLVAPPAE